MRSVLRSVLFFVLFCALSCSKEPPPTSPAGKATDDDCALCDLFGTFNDQQEKEDETEEEEAETDSTSSEGGPDLIVQSPSVSDSMLTPGQAFTLQATVHNQGDEQAAATLLHYYRSNNATITSSDTEVGTDEIGALATLDSSAVSIELIASTGGGPGIYFYGACVASVSGESNTDNNCSTAVRITVSGQETLEEKEDETTQDGTDGDIASGDEADEDTASDASLSAEIFIPDTDLRTYLEEVLKKSPSETITQADMNTLRELNIGYDRGLELTIKSLRGLETAKNLVRLRLTRNEISDLSPLANLTKLKQLDLSANYLPGVIAVEHLTKRQVETALIFFGWTFDTTPAGSSVAIIGTVNASQLSDITPLANLTNLETLIIAYSQVFDLTPVENLTNLRNLFIAYSRISDLTPVENLTNLKQLYFPFNQVSDLTPVENLINLEQLDLSVNQVSDLTPVENLTSLKQLYFTANGVSDLTPVENLINLEQLYFGINYVSDLTPVKRLTKLKQLYFNTNQISDIAPARELHALEKLEAEDNPLSRTSINTHIPALKRSGADVSFSHAYFPDTESPFRIDLVFLKDFTREEQEQWHRIANHWELAIQTELPDYEFPNTWTGQCGSHLLRVPAGEQIDDLRIYITKFDEITSHGVPAQGYAVPMLLRSSSMPILGCVGIERAVSTRADDLWDVGLHEIGHVLGIGTIWGDSGMLRGLGTDPHFAGPQAIAAFNQAGGADYQGAKVPTEPNGGHWHHSVLAGELMVPTDGDALSAITLQALSDLGYSVDLSLADYYVLPSPSAAKPISDGVPFCSLEGLPPPVYVDD